MRIRSGLYAKFEDRELIIQTDGPPVKPADCIRLGPRDQLAILRLVRSNAMDVLNALLKGTEIDIDNQCERPSDAVGSEERE